MLKSVQSFSSFSTTMSTILLTAVLIIGNFAWYVYAEKQIDHSNEQRIIALQLAADLKQSSDDQSRAARSYIVTKDPIFKARHQDLINQREAIKAPTEANPNRYWSSVRATGLRITDAPLPFNKAILESGVTPPEFEKLIESTQNTQALIDLEKQAMRLIEESPHTNNTLIAQAIFIIHSSDYLDAKNKVVTPLQEFKNMANQRTIKAVSTATTQADILRFSLIFFVIFLVFQILRLKEVTLGILGSSIHDLHDRITKIGQGEFIEESPQNCFPQNSVMGWLSELQNQLADLEQARQLAYERQQRITQLYAALSQCNQAIVRCNNQDELFRQVCLAIVQHGGLALAWIGLPDQEGRFLQPAAFFGTGADYLTDLRITLDPNDPRGQGPTGTAFRENHPVWCDDFQHSSQTIPWHDKGIEYHWQSSAAIPLHSDGRITGVLTLYSYNLNGFDEDIRQLLLDLVMDIDYALTSFEHKNRHLLANQELERLAHYDPLTALPNKSLLNNCVEISINQCQKSNTPLSLLLLDLDHFKDINDSLGHTIGDALLVQLAARILKALHPADLASRLGGDEFVILLPNSDAETTAKTAHELLKVISKPFLIGPHHLEISGSIGIVMYPNDGHDFETLSRNADIAMYQAKDDGRHRYRFFTEDMQAGYLRHLNLTNALRSALDANQLHIHYQPQTGMRGEITGCEALLRWTHPEFGSVSPAEFIPIAEKSGLIHPIGEWVLRKVIQQQHQWESQGLPPPIVAVNISAIQFQHKDLPHLIDKILSEENGRADLLELELTESVAMHDPLSAMSTLDELHARGIHLSIDDFGTGYSSLSYLKKFKVNKLKIDQSFIRDICQDADDKAIVTTIIHIAQSLGLRTIAEGVETQEQLEFLQTQGCDEIQGYFISRPIPPDQFADKFLSVNSK